MYIFEASYKQDYNPYNFFNGGLAEAINSTLLQFVLEPQLDNFEVYLTTHFESGPFYQRIFFRPKGRAFVRMAKWNLRRKGYMKISDLPIEIVGIKPAEIDELKKLNSILE